MVEMNSSGLESRCLEVDPITGIRLVFEKKLNKSSLTGYVPVGTIRCVWMLRSGWLLVACHEQFSKSTIARTACHRCDTVYVTSRHSSLALIHKESIFLFVYTIRIIIRDCFSQTGPYLQCQKADFENRFKKRLSR